MKMDGRLVGKRGQDWANAHKSMGDAIRPSSGIGYLAGRDMPTAPAGEGRRGPGLRWSSDK
jgi:hypothetical protein